MGLELVDDLRMNQLGVRNDELRGDNISCCNKRFGELFFPKKYPPKKPSGSFGLLNLAKEKQQGKMLWWNFKEQEGLPKSYTNSGKI